MNRFFLQVLSIVFLILAVAACGPSQAELDSTATQSAVDLSGTQTAQAPTATATSTPSPTATETPTVTPTPTDTPTSTPTPLPQWMSAGLVLEDLPAGFQPMPAQQLSTLQKGLPQDSVVFGFLDEVNHQAVMGYLISYPTRTEQDTFDGMMPDMIELFATAYGATTIPEAITGLDTLGETRAASTFVSGGGESNLRWENILFRRGGVGVILFVFYDDGQVPAIPAGDLARLLDQRLAQSLSFGTLAPGSTIRDGFDAGLLAPWEWIGENPDKWNQTERPGYLRIYASHESGVNWLVRPVAQGDFTIETRVIFEPTTNFQNAGLVILRDVNNFLALGHAFCDTANSCVGNGIYFDNVQAGGFSGTNHATPVDSTDEAYLRLERRGSLIIGFYSPDGITWSKIGEHQIPADFRINGLGIMAGGDFNLSDQDIAADFDYFELTEIK